MSDFFTCLNQETETEREALLAIPFVQHGVRGELSLESYVAFLNQAYHHVKHTTPLLMACGSRVPQQMEWLRDAMAHYIEEELGHQEWILNDIKACGGNPDAVRNAAPDMSTELMCAYAYDVVQRRNPVGLLGMVLVLEGTSIKLATEAARNTKTHLGLPDQAFTYLTSHGALDISHMAFYTGLVNRLSDEADRRFVIHTAKRFYKLYGDIFRALPISLNPASQAA
ncbi:MAG: iron-containing redox enzyme family protein [Candidatus Thiodiazotropha sp. (ex Epidulcina cf. delphinae)]|nr:iron-containing redox enzyme family protein [Candidatus Thiodiazotropha sp. (ex Epidulcina cf. delphinae)]